ncbi:MAG: ribbon-helix-helix domain-containing protein, partial [Planctomycetaceae bacterium]
LLVEVAAFGQRPATDAVEDLTAKSQTGVEPTGGVLLFQTPIATAEPPAFLLDVASYCGYTKSMKTAISIPDHLFNDAERLIARFKTSRSELYSRAIAEFVARHDEDAVTQALDKVVCNVNADPPDTQTSTAS